MRALTARHAAGVAGIALFTVYVLTLARDITFWDAGELIAAVHTVGVPHPPGTPLWVLLARTWSDGLMLVSGGALSRAIATSLFSAACTAVAAGLLGALVARAATLRPAAAAAATVGAGIVASVWLNANETEVYAASLLLSAIALWAGERAGRSGETRHQVLLAYLFALSASLHASALVAGPAAVWLASTDSAGRVRWRVLPLAIAAFFCCAAIAVGSSRGLIAGTILLLIAIAAGRPSPAYALGMVGAIGLGATALLVMLVRAAHDPAVNAGDPRTLERLWDVVARRQYAPVGFWPRQAPVWIQLGNLFEYADWQFALGLAPGVAPSWLRTPVTLVYAVLGVIGARAHARADRRSWAGLALLIAAGTVGVVAVMNFKAGASFGYPFIGDALRHEVRERDYFFALGFATWGLWAGYGAVALLERLRSRLALVGVAVAGLPIVLNWSAVTRRREPEASLPRLAVEALLWSTPDSAVLVTGSDNDTFPLWYVQIVEGLRPDVTVVVAPLLPAAWYRHELRRRHRLMTSSEANRGTDAGPLASLAASARQLGRPLAASIALESRHREAMGAGWRMRGVVYVASAETGAGGRTVVDRDAATRYLATFADRLPTDSLRDGIDRAPHWMARALRCPLDASRLPPDSLDSICNLR